MTGEVSLRTKRPADGYYAIKGNAMDGGYRVDIGPKVLPIVVVGGVAYNTVYGVGDKTPDQGWGPLEIESDDEIVFCGRYTWSPDVGEIDRVGRAAFRTGKR